MSKKKKLYWVCPYCGSSRKVKKSEKKKESTGCPDWGHPIFYKTKI